MEDVLQIREALDELWGALEAKSACENRFYGETGRTMLVATMHEFEEST